MFSCPYGDRNDLPSKEALRKHVARHKKNNSKPEEKSESISQNQRQTEPVKIQNSEHITHPFSDEYRCEKCLHRFTSLEFAEEHYQKRHVDKIPYSETDQKESIQVAKQNQVENPVNIQDQLNEIARQRAAQLAQARYEPSREGIVKQQLFSIAEPSPQREPEPIVESDRPNETDSKPQSPVIINALKSLFKSKNNQRVSQKPIPETVHFHMQSRGVGVDGLNVSISTQPYFCKTENRYLSWNEFLTCRSLGHEVIYANE
jgi:hypothetical protein